MKIRPLAITAILIAFGAAAGACRGEGAPQVSVRAVRDASVSALAAAPFWKTLPAVSDFVNIQGAMPATAKTSCRFAHTPKSLVVQCTAFQSPAITHADGDPANIQKGDNLAFGLSLNDDRAHPVQYVFFANPKGAKWATGTLAPVFSAPWDALVTRTPITWTVTFVIPYSSLKRIPANEQSPRVGFVRSDIESGTAWVWPNIAGKNAMSAGGQARLSGIIFPQ